MIFETFRQAIQNVWNNKLRTFLTMLGIIIGVTAVIVIVGLGNGMMDSMRASFAEMGTNSMQISVWATDTRAVQPNDMYKIVNKNPTLLQSVSPTVSYDGTVRVDTKNYITTQTIGVDEQYTDMKNYTVAQGRKLQYMDIKDSKQVCVIGAYLARVAYGGNAVGQTLKIGTNKFRIVGVLDAKVSDESMQQNSDDDRVYIPYTTALRLSNTTTVSSYLAIMADENQALAAKTAMENGLKNITKSEDYFYVYCMIEYLETMQQTINMAVLVLAAIAGISLLVGGIGIMNIMLVSVTERTREIGIRKAMGAKERTILAQFVVEAATTSALGGILGIVLGYVVSAIGNKLMPYILTDMSTSITITPSFDSVAIAFGISVGIGVLFGYLPARRAARLNPIDALRYD